MTEKKETNKSNSQVMSFRVPYSVYELYEIYCIEEQITMSELLKKAVNKALEQKGST